MDQCTHEVRTEYWKEIILNCRQRPAGQSAKNWLDEHGISEQSYYYWQRKFRQETCGLMKGTDITAPAVSEKTDVSFVEMPHIPLNYTGHKEANNQTAAVIHTPDMSIEISNTISESVLEVILREVGHA